MYRLQDYRPMVYRMRYRGVIAGRAGRSRRWECVTMRTKPRLWLCGNTMCVGRASVAWHRRMVERIEAQAGPRAVADFERAHPDPDLDECDDCGLTGGRHDPTVEH